LADTIKVLNITGYALNLPAIVIWLTVLLRLAGHPLGDALAEQLGNLFPEIFLVVMWVAFPSMALVLGIGSFLLEKKKRASVGVLALSTLLLVLIVFGITVGQSWFVFSQSLTLF
jgi:hypothetical protein